MPSWLAPPADGMVSLPAVPPVAVVRTPPVRSWKVLPVGGSGSGSGSGSVEPVPELVAVERAVVPAQKLVPATHAEDDRAALYRLFQRVALAALEVVRHGYLLLVLPAAEEVEVVAVGVNLVPD